MVLVAESKVFAGVNEGHISGEKAVYVSRCGSSDGLQPSAREDELEVVFREASDPAVVYLIILLAASLCVGV